MKVYMLREPTANHYARAIRLGTWQSTTAEPGCSVCGRSLEQRVSPLIIEWLPGSEEIADFTWPGVLSDLLVTEQVKEALEPICPRLRFLPVEMVQDPKLRRPASTKRSKPRVWLPYSGPTLWDFWVDALLPLKLEPSGFRLKSICSGCGLPSYDKPPANERRLVVDGSAGNTPLFFKINEVPGPFFVTDEGKKVIDRCGFTNVNFVESGVVEKV